MGIEGIRGEKSSASAKRVDSKQVRESEGGAERVVIEHWVGDCLAVRGCRDGQPLGLLAAETIAHRWPVVVGHESSHVTLRETRQSLDGSEQIVVDRRVEPSGDWEILDDKNGLRLRTLGEPEVLHRWPVVVAPERLRAARYPDAPPPRDDANPHARHALCEMLDRLGSDGATAWLNGVGVAALQDELYAFCRELAAHEKHPLLAKIARLDAMVTAEAARADAWMDFADALHKDDNVRLAAAGIAVAKATLAARKAVK